MSISGLVIREAREADLAALIALFAADRLGGHGDTDDPVVRAEYVRAFRAIQASPDQTLYVAELDGEVAGTFQTMVTTTLTGRGSSAMIIEAVQTRGDLRGRGIGAAMIEFCVRDGRRRGVRLVQLTSNAARKDAHRFYERLGFTPSHIGFKMGLK
jgi:GNAT superfamily N-acetyltransferase